VSSLKRSERGGERGRHREEEQGTGVISDLEKVAEDGIEMSLLVFLESELLHALDESDAERGPEGGRGWESEKESQRGWTHPSCCSCKK
jgi:hypothetical protein